MKFSILISILFLCSSALDHTDTPLTVDSKGEITGLPDKYYPAKFEMNDRYLRIKNRELKFPDCLEDYFANADKTKINLSASWYHSKEIIPHYLNMEFGQKNEDYIFSLLLNLETLELIEARKIIRKETYGSRTEIDLSKECLQDYQDNNKKVN